MFEIFDRDQNGRIDFDEFLREITGEMNETRKELVRSAFTKFDRDGNGRVNIDDIKGSFNAS